ncbi:fungal specific transcription factor domain-containing protein [Botrytis cinerea]
MAFNTTEVPHMQSRSSKQSRNRTLLSCTECHRRKQKCSRNHPCNDCLERRVPHKCRFVIPLRQRDSKLDYETAKAARDRRILSGEEILLSFESVEDLRSAGSSYASTHASTDVTRKLFSDRTPTHDTKLQASFRTNLTSGILDGFDPFSVFPDTSGDPLPKSILIEYFVKQLGPWLGSYNDSEVVGRPAFSWLTSALQHPPLFHATLLGAAVHLDRKRPIDKRSLFWYKIETIRLANETMNIPHEAATDQMILVVLILLYFNVGGGDGEEYEMHLSGINKMLTMRGGMDTLGMSGMITNWLKVCYGPWNHDWHYGLFVDFYGIKRKSHNYMMK